VYLSPVGRLWAPAADVLAIELCPGNFSMMVLIRKFVCAGLVSLSATCAFAMPSTRCSQERGANGSVTPAQVAEIIDHLRASSVDKSLLAQALEMGGLLLRQGRYTEAAELFGLLAQKQPGDFAVLYGQALAAFNLGRVAESEPMARKAVELAEAAAGAERADRSFPSAADALVLLSVVLAVRGDDSEALKVLERAVRLAPDNFDAQLALGRLRFGMGDDGGAVRAFRAAISLMPWNGPALFCLATALDHSGDTAGAQTAYDELIKRQPKMAEGHLGLGVLLLKRGTKMEEGIKELQLALQIDPNLYEARITLGRALISMGRSDVAIEHLRRAAELAPDNPEPHYQLSLAYRRLGNKDQSAAESAIVKRIHNGRRSGKPANADQP
jgi:Flp pilus assembly protein TadD